MSEYGEVEAKTCLKDYAVKMMDEYAKNFERPGINGNEDLLWFGKLEHYRYYTFRDKEVKEGFVKAGSLKPGSNWHLQITVSRKDITNSVKLSPMNNSRGKNAEHSAKLGQFDRSAFKQSGEHIFDSMFWYERGFKETFEYANTQVNGRLEQKIDMARAQMSSRQELSEANTEVRLDSLVDILLKQEHSEGLGEIFRKKKRSRENQQDHGISMGR